MAFSRRLGRILAGMVAVAGVLLISQPQFARAATGDFEIQAPLGADRATYLVRGGLQTCDSSNNCTGGLTQPKTMLLLGAPQARPRPTRSCRWTR